MAGELIAFCWVVVRRGISRPPVVPFISNAARTEALALLPINVLPVPVIAPDAELLPIATTSLEFESNKLPFPIDITLLAVVLPDADSSPIAILLNPVVLFIKADSPIAVLL